MNATPMLVLNDIPLYCPPDLDSAFDEWGCNCGPAALAAILERPAAEVRAFFPGFEKRRYANPSQMLAACKAAGVLASIRTSYPWGSWPIKLVKIQWGGSWLKPGVHPGAAYARTHWIAVRGRATFDVNVGYWVDADEWGKEVAPYIMEHVKGCDGTWHPVTAIFVGRATA